MAARHDGTNTADAVELTDIELHVDDPVAIVRLNRPDKLNAFTFDTLSQIHAAVQQASADERVVGIVITGNGRGFCAGLDVADLEGATGGGPTEAPYQSQERLPGLFSYFLDTPKPVIAAVNGVAAGGGLVLALMSDLRFASTDASFVTVFLKRGLIAEHGSSWLLPRLVGVGHALDLLWSSDRIDATRAYEMGLVQRLVAPDELLRSATDYVRHLAENVSPAAMAETKRLVYAHLGTGFEAALHEAELSQNRFVGRSDAAEGARALIEKRPPGFGRLGKR